MFMYVACNLIVSLCWNCEVVHVAVGVFVHYVQLAVASLYLTVLIIVLSLLSNN